MLDHVRDCQLASTVDVAVQVATELQLIEVGNERLMATEHMFDEVLEDRVEGIGTSIVIRVKRGCCQDQRNQLKTNNTKHATYRYSKITVIRN